MEKLILLVKAFDGGELMTLLISFLTFLGGYRAEEIIIQLAGAIGFLAVIFTKCYVIIRKSNLEEDRFNKIELPKAEHQLKEDEKED